MKGMLLVGLAGLVLVGGQPPAAAGGATATARSDGDDTTSVLDIRKVATDTSRRNVFLGVRSWDPYSSADVDGANDSYFVFLLDTKKRGRADKYAYLYYDSADDLRFECAVYNRSGGFKGQRRATRLGADDIACATPKKWYDIRKPVRFGVEAWELGSFRDRAPNDGRYTGL